MQPDYSIYPQIDSKTAYGFLTRGCPNRCKWCVVPKKEGKITPYMDIEEIAVNGRKNIILMDNNVLASDYGLQQIEKIVSMGVRVDFNQGLDGLFGDNPNNPYREDDINNAYKAIEEMEKLVQKVYPDRSGFLKNEEKQ